MGKDDPDYGLKWRYGSYSVYMRVPARYKAVDSRTFFVKSLGTDSLRIARSRRDREWENQVNAWEALLRGQDPNAQYQAAVDLAKTRGITYLEAPVLAKRSTEEILQRIERLSTEDVQVNSLEAKAVLGGVSKPVPKISEIFEEYKRWCPEDYNWKSPIKYRKWENPHTKAVRNFIYVVGDLRLNELHREHFLMWKTYALNATSRPKKPLQPQSVNKDTIHLRKMFGRLDTYLELDLDIHKKSQIMVIEDGEPGRKPPFSDEWISDRLLAKGALDGLNKEARGIFLMMFNTGARVEEIDSLREEDIVLDENVPYINITPSKNPDGSERRLKTKNSKRKIPLTGVSLEAARHNSKGFPRYRGNGQVSAAVNKFLRKNGLRETPKHTMYSARHNFEDRMLRGGVDERVRRQMLGHSLDRERYGEGGGLEFLHKELAKIAF